MKKIIIIMLIVFSVTGCGRIKKLVGADDQVKVLNDCREEKKTDPKIKISVENLVNDTRFKNKMIGNIAREVIVSEFSKRDSFFIVDRKGSNSAAEILKSSTDSYQSSEDSDISIQYIVAGSLVKYLAEDAILGENRVKVAVDIKMINVRTGEIWSQQGEGKAVGGGIQSLEEEALKVAVKKAVEGVVQKLGRLSWSSKVIEAGTEKVIIGAGETSGVKIGTELDVYEQVGRIEVGNQLLGYEERLVGRAKVKEYTEGDTSLAEYRGTPFKLPALVKIRRQ